MDKNTAKILHIVAFSLAMIGALNWGLVGLFSFNLVETILVAWPTLERIVYILVGVSAVYILFTHSTDCKICSEMMKKS